MYEIACLNTPQNIDFLLNRLTGVRRKYIVHCDLLLLKLLSGKTLPHQLLKAEFLVLFLHELNTRELLLLNKFLKLMVPAGVILCGTVEQLALWQPSAKYLPSLKSLIYAKLLGKLPNLVDFYQKYLYI